MVTVGQGQGVILKSSQEIDLMRTAGKILAEVLLRLREEVRPGVTTADLDAVAAKEMKRHHVEPSFLGYHGYPARLCASVNDEIVHGIPGPKVLNEGDIIGLDCGVIYKGFQADSAVTVPVGQITDDTQRLVDVTRTSLEAGIAAARNGARIGDISAAIQAVIEAAEFAIVREYVGHGIGRKLHEEPQVPNFGVAGRGLLLRKGMALALEPMVNAGTWQTRVAPDHWTVLTADGELSAHFEHTISITDDEPEVMTKL